MAAAKEGGGLAPDHLQVDGFGRTEVLHGGELQHLAFRDHGRGVGEDVHDAQRVGFHHELEAAGEKVVAHEDGGFVVPQEVRRGAATAALAFVHHVVMQERGGVDEFHRRGQFDMVVAVIAADAGCGERQHGAQAFAPRLDQMGGDFGDAGRVFGCHARADQGVDRLHVLREPCGERSCGFCAASSKLIPHSLLTFRGSAP